MPRRSTQDALFPRSSRPAWLGGAGFGLLLGGFLGTVAVIVNPDLPWLWLVVTVAGAVALSLSALTRRILTVFSGLIAALLLICLLTPILRPLEAALDVTEAPVKADAIVTLGAGMRCGANQLESASQARVVTALQLWRQGYAPTVTFSDTKGLWPDCDSLATVARETARQLDGPGDGPNLLVLPDVHSTRDEAQAVAKLARERGWKRVLIVTSPSHSRRARTTFQQLKLNASVVAASEPRFDTELRLPYDRLMAIPALVREVAGVVKYSLFGWF